MNEHVGNILDVVDGVIVHQTNCQDKIGAGVAQALIDRYPVVKQKYHEFCASTPDPWLRLGTIQPVPVTPTLTVVNSFSQFYYGNGKKHGEKYTFEPLLIRNVQKVLDYYPDRFVCVPGYIGCGLANGDWDYCKAQFANLRGHERLWIVYLGQATA